MCPLCGSIRVPGDPIEIQRFNDLHIIHYLLRYDCGLAIEFSKIGSNYVKDKVTVSKECLKIQKKLKP